MSADGAADLQRWRHPPIVRLLSPGSLLPGNHTHKVWRGLAQTPGNTEPGVPLIVKWLEKNEHLAADLACALAAQALRLQVPAGMLVLAEKDQLPSLPRRVTGAGSNVLLCFGSEYQWPDDTAARPTEAVAVEEWIWRRLCETAQAPAGAVWDELVANDDRHHENVVFDGSKWWLIDHESTLDPVAKVMKRFAEQQMRLSVIDHASPTNRLAKEVLTRRPSDHKMEAIPDVWKASRQRVAWLAEQSQKWHTPHEPVNTVLMMTHVYLRSIELRLPALALHLQSRLSKPESILQWNSSSPSANRRPPRSSRRRPA